MKAYIEVLTDLCKGCELCIYSCPKKLISMSDEMNTKGVTFAKFSDPDEKCTGCGFCWCVCPDFAIEVFKEVKV